MVKALVIISEGSEEIEAVTVVDVLRRGKVAVTLAGLANKNPVVCSRNVIIQPDTALSDVINESFDVIVLPGGLKGSENFSKSNVVGEILKKQEEKNKFIAAICAAPTALASHKIGSSKTITSYPCFEEQLTKAGYKYSQSRVAVDGKLITSRGPGTAFEFALSILENIGDAKEKEEVEKGLLLK